MFIRSSSLLFFYLFLLAVPAQAQFQAHKHASELSCDCYQLTPDVNYQRGSVWRTEKIDLTEPFDLRFDFFLGARDGGADGIVFILQPHSDTALGQNGGGIGYEGIDTSLAVEFDTWENAWGDPAEDHIAIFQNGNVEHNNPDNLAGPVDMISGGGNVEDSAYHRVRITWEPDNEELSVYYEGDLRLTYSDDVIDNIFQGDPKVYWGLSSGTAMAKNEHRFCTVLEPEFQAEEKDTLACPDEGLQFIDSSYATIDIEEYHWELGDGTESNSIDPEHRYEGSGNYDVKLAITDIAGCKSSVSHPVSIEVKDCDPLIELPNVFTPNRDGDNDLARPVELRNVKELHTRIYNRWGQLLYDSKGEKIDWDGTTPEGQDAPEGTYYWVVNYIGTNGEKGDRTGSLHLLR